MEKGFGNLTGFIYLSEPLTIHLLTIKTIDMKRVIFALAALLAFSAWHHAGNNLSGNNQPEIAAANQNEKVTICHRTGNGSSHPITVSIHAVPAHLAHGDVIGDCSGGNSRTSE
jgi:hypothetical protein